jgi:drug/metabolite transporter (DMT)-like permease
VSAVAVLLALASSATWGLADFCGGLLSRRLPTIPVTVISQAAGFAALLAALAIAGGEIDGRSLWLGVLAGVGGGIGLAAFYKALSLGTMSIVSPVVACGAVVPFAISIATGERPSGLAVAGAVIALTGAVLASTEERRAPEPNRARAVAIALLAAVALGLFTYFLGLGSREGSALSTLVGARIGSLTILLALAAGTRSSLRVGRRWLLPIAAVGLCDVAANALFALASGRGLLSLVSVLGSLYPVTTVLLAYAILHERLTRVQVAGISVALAGVAALSAG